jgi:Ni2+-binding GTPase involved in maturation of urease and hydrogenase
MKLITVSGPPSSGKTSVLLKTIEQLNVERNKIGVIKFDCLTTYDDRLYEKTGVTVRVGLSGNLCPDHYFVSNIEDCVNWGLDNGFEYLISESAGLCNRCAPHIKEILAVCVIDNLSGINTPRKIGPMLKTADIVVITKGDIVSQAEREVFEFKVRQANVRSSILHVNGITGQGSFDLSKHFGKAFDISGLDGRKLRFSIPAALCSYCLGEVRIGEDYQRGNIKKINLGEKAK